jgi:hydrogenase expression/formation protein HypD
MKYIDEFRDAAEVRRYADAIRETVTTPWTLMEVCGGQTHAIVRFGLDTLLPEGLTLIHGPGCPVCVTPPDTLDDAIELAARPTVTICSFGDMLRVPGSPPPGETFGRSLLDAKTAGGDVRVVYSPLDAVALAERQPEREVVFLAVGFETTAPANAMAVLEARRRGVGNFSMLVSHVLVPPAMEAVLSAPQARVQGFLAAGHVCTIMGTQAYQPIAKRYGVPIVVTGFEPLDILQGVLMAVRQLEEGRAEVENQYARSVRKEGNAPARAVIEQVFEVTDRSWRGLGPIPKSGLALRAELASFCARRRFELGARPPASAGECESGLILTGLKRPSDCPAFGTRCTPEHPLGPTMVSTEGACAAYYRYRRSPVS